MKISRERVVEVIDEHKKAWIDGGKEFKLDQSKRIETLDILKIAILGLEDET